MLLCTPAPPQKKSFVRIPLSKADQKGKTALMMLGAVLYQGSASGLGMEEKIRDSKRAVTCEVGGG